MTTKMYRQMNIFKRYDNSTLIYRCFESLDTGMFHVQSKDTIYHPIDRDQLKNSEIQLFELFTEEDISERSQPYTTVELAIKAFDEEFQ